MRLVFFACLFSVAVVARAEVKFRVPLDMSPDKCGSGCGVSAYYDTDRGGGVRDYACGGATYQNHDAVDIAIGGFGAMDAGRPVVAAAAGTVIEAHDGEFDRCTTGNCGQANYVKLRHADGRVTYYWHLKKWSVRVSVGQEVACGQPLGLVGSSGLSTGPHVHFAVVDPVYGKDDPYKGQGCGGPLSWWVEQRGYRSLPSAQCMAGQPTHQSGFCTGKIDGGWCDGRDLVFCSAGAVSTRTTCEHACESMPYGVNDRCYIVRGAIEQKYLALGGRDGFLGKPVMSEKEAPGGGRYNRFEHGAIHWKEATGAHEVHGPIRAKWRALGAWNSDLGYPKTDVLAVDGGSKQTFEGGVIRYDAATGKTTVTPNGGGQ